MRGKRSIFLSLAVIGLVASMIAAATGAVFTDTATSTGNQFQTGTLNIKLADDNEGAADDVSASISFSNMAPGDSVVKPITVSNPGSLGLRYALTSSSTNADGKDLKGQIVLKVVQVAGTGSCSASAFSGSPAYLYNGALGAAAFGDVTTGAQTGDRAVAASASEVLCLQASLPIATGNAFQGAATTATFTFTAEQTANN
ncbi:MAG: M73 family metallopeptidase [Dehalococcoidia bacterium]|nr:M73 family metallopeptidase [Dehalococcoidia bacterium]